MVVSDRYMAQTGYQTSRIHSFSTDCHLVATWQVPHKSMCNKLAYNFHGHSSKPRKHFSHSFIPFSHKFISAYQSPRLSIDSLNLVCARTRHIPTTGRVSRIPWRSNCYPAKPERIVFAGWFRAKTVFSIDTSTSIHAACLWFHIIWICRTDCWPHPEFFNFLCFITITKQARRLGCDITAFITKQCFTPPRIWKWYVNNRSRNLEKKWERAVLFDKSYHTLRYAVPVLLLHWFAAWTWYYKRKLSCFTIILDLHSHPFVYLRRATVLSILLGESLIAEAIVFCKVQSNTAVTAWLERKILQAGGTSLITHYVTAKRDY